LTGLKLVVFLEYNEFMMVYSISFGVEKKK